MLPFLVAALWLPTLQVDVATSPTLLSHARRTLDLIYDMRFDDALEAAHQVVRLAPDRPAGYFYQAATYWQWQLVAPAPQPRQDLIRRFWSASERTLQVAERLPGTHAAEAAFYRGAAYGMQARMYAAAKRYGKALKAAKRGGAFLQTCVQLDPAWHDAYLGLGLYHYALTRVPPLWRGLMQWLIGMKGDRLQGLRELERARTQGLLARTEAASLLARIYASSAEQQYGKAHALLTPLAQEYPHNFDYRYRLLVVSLRLGRLSQARQIGERLADDIARGDVYASPDWRLLVHYRIAETLLLQGDSQTALPLVQRLLEQAHVPDLRAWLTLRLGNALELQGDPRAARQTYRQVHGEAEAKRLAARYLTAPFDRSQLVIKPPEKIM